MSKMTVTRRLAAWTVLAAVSLAGAAHQSQAADLVIYNWSQYTAPDLIKKFEKETGLTVSVDNFDSNETLLAKLKSGGSGYDLTVVQSNFMPVFIQQKLLVQIDAATLPNYENLDGKWKAAKWDDGNHYSIPWAVGVTSFTVDTAVYKESVDSLKTLFEPPEELRGKINMFGSPSDLMALALIYLDKPLCTTAPEDLKALNKLLMAQKPFVKVYSTDFAVPNAMSGETAVNQIWSGAAVRAKAERNSLKFIFPKEGVLGWVDSLVIPVGAPHVENAKKFIAFMMKPENAALEASFSAYSTGIKGSDALIADKVVANAPEYRIPEGTKIVYTESCGEDSTRAWDKIFQRLRQ